MDKPLLFLLLLKILANIFIVAKKYQATFIEVKKFSIKRKKNRTPF